MCVICMRARVCVRECECVLVRTIKCFDIKRLLFAAELNYFANGITSIRQRDTEARERGARGSVGMRHYLYRWPLCRRQALPRRNGSLGGEYRAGAQKTGEQAGDREKSTCCSQKE